MSFGAPSKPPASSSSTRTAEAPGREPKREQTAAATLSQWRRHRHGPCFAQRRLRTGPNQKIASNDLARALGTDTIDALSKHTGVGREDLLSGLSQHLPNLVDQLSPNGRLPTEEEASRMV